MTQLRVIPKGQQISAMNFFADRVVLTASGWDIYQKDNYQGCVWSGYANLMATASDPNKALMVLPK